MSEGTNGSSAAQATAGRQEKLDGVCRIVAVTSCKGGVGKSTVAVNLAVSLRALGHRVGYADLDIYGPSAPVMLGVDTLPEPDGETRRIRPVEAHGLQVMSMGFFLDDEAPVVWRGPMVMSATKQFMRGVAWRDLDYLIADLPPGTGDVALTLAQEVVLDGGIVVTTPQDVAMVDVVRGAAMLRKVNTPVLGVVANMAGYVCTECGTRDDLFGSLSGAEISAAVGAPLVAEIPIVEAVRVSGDAGTPISVAEPDHPVSRAFMELALAVEKAVGGDTSAGRAPEPTDIDFARGDGRVHVAWSDGVKTSYAPKGLRGWCPCAVCQGHASEIKFVDAEETSVTGFEGVGRYAVRFLWSDGHGTGMYSYGYLRELADYAECQG